MYTIYIDTVYHASGLAGRGLRICLGLCDSEPCGARGDNPVWVDAPPWPQLERLDAAPLGAPPMQLVCPRGEEMQSRGEEMRSRGELSRGAASSHSVRSGGSVGASAHRESRRALGRRRRGGVHEGMSIRTPSPICQSYRYLVS